MVNAPDPINKPRATKEDLKLSDERWYSSPNKKDKNKKKNIMSNLNKVVKESNDEFSEN